MNKICSALLLFMMFCTSAQSGYLTADPFFSTVDPFVPVPHKCTCGCETTGKCDCPNCSTGCGFIPKKESTKCGITGCTCGCANDGSCSCTKEHGKGFQVLDGAVWEGTGDSTHPGYFLKVDGAVYGFLHSNGEFRYYKNGKWSDRNQHCPYKKPAKETRCNGSSCVLGYFGDQPAASGFSGGCSSCGSGGCSMGSCGSGGCGSSSGCSGGSCGGGGFFRRR